MRKKKKYRFPKVILWIVAILLFNLLAGFISLQIPAVQTEIAHYLSRKLSARTGFTITLKAVDIDWLDKFTIEGLSVVDEHGQPLLLVDWAEVDYKLASLLRGEIKLDHASLKGLDLSLHKTGSDTLNISRFINQLKKNFSSKKRGTTSSVTIDYIQIAESRFSYQHGPEAENKGVFNASAFGLEHINGEFKSLAIVGDTIQVEVLSLETTEENTGLTVHNLEAAFMISPRQMRFDSLRLLAGNSVVQDNIVFNYDNYADLSHFTDSVTITASLKNTKLTSNDLRYFIPYFNKIDDKITLSGDFKGELSHFSVRNLNLRFGNGSRMAGRVYFAGLPDISETFIDISLKNSLLIGKDLEKYVPAAGLKKINRFSRVVLDASFTGYVNDFVADGKFRTNLGIIDSDINLKVGDNASSTSYSGMIALTDFDLGAYFNRDRIGKATLQGHIAGTGIDLPSARFAFDGAVDSLMLFNYNYTNITTSGTFQQEYFSGVLNIDDPNLKLETTNEIDLRNQNNRIKIDGELIFADLQALKLNSEPSTIRSKIEADLRGFHIDSLQGHVYLEEVYAQQNNNETRVSNLTFNSVRENGQRTAELISDYINIKITGNFNYTTAYRDIKYMVQEYLVNLANNKDSIAAFYTANPPIKQDLDYSIKLSGKFGNIDNYIELFRPDLSFHGATSFDLDYQHARISRISLQIANDSITYKNNLYINNQVNLDASKVRGEDKILAAADIQSQEQILGNGTRLKDIIASAVWNNKKIDFNWYHRQPNIKNINDIYGEIHFFNDSTHIHFNRSNLSLLDNTWHIQEDNSITLKAKEIIVRNLNIFSKNQKVAIAGVVSQDPDEVLEVEIQNLEMGLINPLITKKLSGRLSGEFAISNMYNSATIVSDFYINNFSINQFLIGNIFSSNDWNNTTQKFDIQFVVNRDDIPVILVNGFFNPFDEQHALDLHATFKNARLDMSEPFIETLFSELQGSITGKMHLTGPVMSPVITGGGSFNNASLKVNYLNTIYSVTGSWAFDSTAIYLQKMRLTDKFDNTATLDGSFTHQHLKNFRIDLTGEMDNFLVLNTSSKDNDLFYGTGVASGTVAFIGPINDVTIRSQAKTERGTRFFMPMGGSSSTEFEDYITFVNFSDTVNTTLNEEDKAKIRGINIDFDIDITEEAYAEIIFDINSGDIIRGRGNGHLSMNINSQGEFTMLGNYEFVSGGYNFTMYNIVNKEFTINPKSKITWSGDPYNGIMDIKASYKLTTSLAPLIDTVYHDLPEVKRIYPTEVLLTLLGPLQTPDIEFEIIIDDYPKSNVDMDTQIKGFLNTIANDQQELNRQVFSLLIFRRFSPPNSFSSSGTIGSSVSEFVSNQLSYWISQVDENLTIDMDLGDLDEDALRTFQLRISYTFLDGKLIVTRDGGFTNPNNEASVGSIAGDWTLEYLLSEDGKLRIKLFNKTNYNQLNSTTGSASQALITGGFSLIFTTSFDKFSDLWKKSDKTNEGKSPDPEPTSSGLKPEEIQYFKK